MSQTSSALPERSWPQPRPMGAVNWVGLYVLTKKEINRFTKVTAQTIIAPLVTTLLFYAVFALALGGAQKTIGGLPYLAFLAPGLIMMSMAQNAFANSSSSLVVSKISGNIVDTLMPPLSPLEFTMGYMLGGIARGLAVGAASMTALFFFVDFPSLHFGYMIFHAVAGSMMLALLGLIGGIWSEKFDHLATVQNFIVMPATFLSGTFYTADRLPEAWRFICHLNPFFYMIDGFRYGFIGVSDGTLGTGILVILLSNLVLLIVAYQMVARGYKLKS